MRRIIQFLFASILFVSCDNVATQKFIVDNPKDESITISIDGEVYEIPSVSSIDLTLEIGNHTLKMNDDSVKFFVKTSDLWTIINPTLSNYILYYDMYIDAENIEKGNAQAEKIVKAYYNDFIQGSDTLTVTFKVANELFISQYDYFWHYSVNQPMPKTAHVDMSSTNLSTTVRAKLFREAEFNDLAKKELGMESGFDFGANSRKLSDMPAFDPFGDIETYNVSCPAALAELDSIKMYLNKMLHASPSEYKKASLDYTLHSVFSSEVDNYCYVGYNKETGDSAYWDLRQYLHDVRSVIGKHSAIVIK